MELFIFLHSPRIEAYPKNPSMALGNAGIFAIIHGVIK
jgi:hypothetical protein